MDEADLDLILTARVGSPLTATDSRAAAGDVLNSDARQEE